VSSAYSDYSVYSVFYSVYSVLYHTSSVLFCVYSVFYSVIVILLHILYSVYSVLSSNITQIRGVMCANGGFCGTQFEFDYT